MRNKYILFLCSLFTTVVSFSQVVIKPSEPNPVPSNEQPIGKTEGKLDISLTGALVYSIPIQVPVGVNGMEPQVSLVYNSQSNATTVGVGWEIAGLSTISRIPSTLYHDGRINEINFSATD